MKQLAIKAENISKQYRLGEVGTGTLSHDLNRFWHKVRGLEDPYLKIGEANDRSSKGESDYVWSLRDINFEIEQGDAVGIIGRNGAGKSTLLKLLSKVTKPTTGSFKVNGRIASLLEVGTGFNPEMTGRENIYLNGAILGMRRHEITRKMDEIIDFSGVERYIDTPVKRYSSGMYVRLAFAVAAHLESEILIVDEVLAVGDAEFQKKCLGKMGDVSKGEGRTVLFVSHNMGAIQKLCNNSIYLNKGQLVNIDNTKIIVSEYLGDRNYLSNYKEYSNFLKYIKIEQNIDKLILTAEYDVKTPIDRPSLGFIIYNSEGIPLYGSNPTIENLQFAKNNYLEGKIIVEIYEPKLIDGVYILSIWFGDSKDILLQDLECLSLEITNMTTNRQYNQSITGNIVPKTKWIY
jgi:lipopolysaccharide transport system ATP-binding protein